MFRKIIIIFFLSFSAYASAETLFWVPNYTPTPYQKFSTPEAACTYFKTYSNTHGGTQISNVPYGGTPPLYAACRYSSNGTTFNTVPLSNSASTCVAPQVWNNSTQACGAPPNPCVSGTVVSSGYYDGGKSPSAAFPSTTCDGTCSATFSGNWPATSSMLSDGVHYYAFGNFAKDGFQCSTNSAIGSTSAVPSSTTNAESQAALAAKQLIAKNAAAAKALADAAAAKAAAEAAAAKAKMDAVNADPASTQAQKDAATTNYNTTNNTSITNNNAAAAAAGDLAAAQQLDTSGLNQEGTQQRIAISMTQANDKLKTINDSLNCTDCTVLPNPTTQQVQNVKDENTKVTDIFGTQATDQAGFHNLGWSTWVPDFPSSNCSPYTFTLQGHSLTWNYCPYIAKLNELMGWLLAIWGCFTISGMFFNKGKT